MSCAISASDSQDAVCDVYGKRVRYCGNTTNLMKYLRLTHSTEYDTFVMRVCCGQKRRSQCCSFNVAGKHYPGTRRDNVAL